MNEVKPTRRLFDPSPVTRMPWVPPCKQSTDGVLARWLWERSEMNPSNYPSDDDCNEVDAAGRYTGSKT